MFGWDQKEDKLDGSEEFGDSTDDTEAWGIQFDNKKYNRFRIESGDMSFTKEYSKEELVGKMQDEKFLSLKNKGGIIAKGGVNIFI